MSSQFLELIVQQAEAWNIENVQNEQLRLQNEQLRLKGQKNWSLAEARFQCSEVVILAFFALL